MFLRNINKKLKIFYLILLKNKNVKELIKEIKEKMKDKLNKINDEIKDAINSISESSLELFNNFKNKIDSLSNNNEVLKSPQSFINKLTQSIGIEKINVKDEIINEINRSYDGLFGILDQKVFVQFWKSIFSSSVKLGNLIDMIFELKKKSIIIC